MIPEEWGVARVCELVKNGPKNGYSGPTGKDPSGTPTLSLSATTSGKMILNSETVKHLDARIPPGSPLFLAQGDVLVQRSNTAELVGTTAVFNGEPATYIYPDLMMRLRFRERSSGEWFWRCANSAQGRRYFAGAAAGSTGSMPKLSGSHIREMPIPWPDPMERAAVIRALNDADGLIESLERLRSKKRQIKQGAMQELLTGRRRLPGFGTDGGYRDSDVGPIPKDWNVRCIGDIAHITTGGKNTQDSVDDGRYPFFVRSQNVERINTYSFEGEAVLTAGDGVGTGKVFHYINGRFDTHQRVYLISDFSENISGRFFYLYFSTNFYNRIMQMTAKSSVDSVRREMISRMPIPAPADKVEQTAIADVISDMDAEIDALEKKLEKARQIKQGMMQELLTGKIRLI
jgi:type I restriction enzyme S subunit